ncbi:peptide-methionine (S)-S-oxide reductase MsrA [Paracoccus litorisediminis]|jgi:peptide-methionine (S)-S-oxide reductase|uniref:Peptide methionine sulfoxide reductase MsrA n=1 Tax=Paracoccus litorisediminis TaxID=2006130 RepID=A0A844HU15_9RHOB|nr:peptide-methionine (S)-S-oxide reductase MsrA [Paracoccus litorisediminis]MTH62568.1 peptide-methionine (S)-S-oxide reductase MsrA [Paracoccus litorisediminis]
MISPLAAIIRPIHLAVIAIALSMGVQVAQAQEGLKIPPPRRDIAASGSTQTALFAGGCFWGVQGVFQHVVGVKNAVSGYAGGAAATAEYRRVGSGRTGHAEAVRISYDPSKISYGKLLQIFFSAAHDPTQLNRQGPDTGTQYRSAIFPQNKEQAAVARAYIDQLKATRLYSAPIVTIVEPGKSFYPAETYHKDYLVNNPTQPYIRINDLPKIEHLRNLFPDVWRKNPVLVAEAGTNG